MAGASADNSSPHWFVYTALGQYAYAETNWFSDRSFATVDQAEAFLDGPAHDFPGSPSRRYSGWYGPIEVQVLSAGREPFKGPWLRDVLIISKIDNAETFEQIFEVEWKMSAADTISRVMGEMECEGLIPKSDDFVLSKELKTLVQGRTEKYRLPELECALDESWDFFEVAMDARRRLGHLNPNDAVGYEFRLFSAALDLEDALRVRHRQLTAMDVGHFWTSLQVWVRLAEFCRRTLWTPKADQRDIEAARRRFFRKLGSYVHSIDVVRQELTQLPSGTPAASMQALVVSRDGRKEIIYQVGHDESEPIGEHLIENHDPHQLTMSAAPALENDSKAGKASPRPVPHTTDASAAQCRWAFIRGNKLAEERFEIVLKELMVEVGFKDSSRVVDVWCDLVRKECPPPYYPGGWPIYEIHKASEHCCRKHRAKALELGNRALAGIWGEFAERFGKLECGDLAAFRIADLPEEEPELSHYLERPGVAAPEPAVPGSADAPAAEDLKAENTSAEAADKPHIKPKEIILTPKAAELIRLVSRDGRKEIIYQVGHDESTPIGTLLVENNDPLQVRAAMRAAWMDKRHPGWSLVQWRDHAKAAGTTLAYETLKKYREGVMTNRTPSVRADLAQVENVQFSDIPE
jgi:hypothetical protein